ncbi:MAG: ABC transporter permease [Rhodothermaceae bacterium]
MNTKLSQFSKENDWIKPLGGLIVLFIACVIFSPISTKGNIIFLKIDNLTNILRQVSEIGIIAVGMTLVILTSGIDLSVGSVLALSATLTAFGVMDWQLGVFLTVLLAVSAGALIGMLNGAITSWGKMQSFIVTLAGMTAARGFALFISDNHSRNIGFGEMAAPESFKIFTSTIFTIPFPVYIFIFITIIFIIILRKMTIGRYIYAIGSNEKAAVLAGLKVNWVRTIAFTFSGFLAGLAGVIHSAQLYQGNPNDGAGFELDAIAAVVIGGTNLLGGRGTMEGTFFGVLIIGLLSNILGLHGIEKDFQLMLKGIIIVLAVFVQGQHYQNGIKNIFTKMIKRNQP